MDRRTFVSHAGVAAGALWLPAPTARRRDRGEDRKALADAALNAARQGGAGYADVRISRYLTQSLGGRERSIQTVSAAESYGAGVRVLVGGAWGFAATADVTTDGLVAATREAVAVARANASLQSEPVQLAPTRGYGEVTWRTPVRRDPFAMPVKEKAEYLVSVGDAALSAGASFVSFDLDQISDQKYFASTDGSYIDQAFTRINPGFSVTVVDREKGFAERTNLARPVAMGWEYLEGREQDGIVTPAGTLVWGTSYDMVTDARRGRRRGEGEAFREGRGGGHVGPGARSLASVAHDPRIRRPPARARPRARLRGQLRGHQLHHARQVEEPRVPVRQPARQLRGRPYAAGFARRGRLG
jgi:TldD protein